MALFDRITNPAEGASIAVHQFAHALEAWAQGDTTRADIVSYFNISAGDETDLDWLKAQYEASTEKARFIQRLHGAMLLAESNYTGYGTQADIAAKINGWP